MFPNYKISISKDRTSYSISRKFFVYYVIVKRGKIDLSRCIHIYVEKLLNTVLKNPQSKNVSLHYEEYIHHKT
jgi:hypothetical protein